MTEEMLRDPGPQRIEPPAETAAGTTKVAEVRRQGAHAKGPRRRSQISPQAWVE